MSRNFDISVVMAAYNVEPYLREAVDSVVNQTIGFEQHVQLVLVNDGSTDNTAAICCAYAEQFPENIIVIDQPNAGVSAARNVGLERATGRLVNFMDADDVWDLHAFAAACAFMADHDVNLVACRIREFEARSRYLSLDGKFDQGDRVIDIAAEPEAIQLSLVDAFIKRSAIGDTRFDTTLKVGEDAKFMTHLIVESGRYGVIRHAVYHARERLAQSSATQNFDASRYEETMDGYYWHLAGLKTEYPRYAEYLDRCVVNGMRFRIRSLPDVPLANLDGYRAHVQRLVAQCSDASIAQAISTPSHRKLFMFGLKYGFDVANADAALQAGHLWFRSWDLGAVATDSLTINRTKIEGERLCLHGRFATAIAHPQLFACYAGSKMQAELEPCAKADEHGLFESAAIRRGFSFEVRAPVNSEPTDIEFLIGSAQSTEEDAVPLTLKLRDLAKIAAFVWGLSDSVVTLDGALLKRVHDRKTFPDPWIPPVAQYDEAAAKALCKQHGISIDAYLREGLIMVPEDRIDRSLKSATAHAIGGHVGMTAGETYFYMADAWKRCKIGAKDFANHRVFDCATLSDLTAIAHKIEAASANAQASEASDDAADKTALKHIRKQSGFSQIQTRSVVAEAEIFYGTQAADVLRKGLWKTLPLGKQAMIEQLDSLTARAQRYARRHFGVSQQQFSQRGYEGKTHVQIAKNVQRRKRTQARRNDLVSALAHAHNRSADDLLAAIKRCKQAFDAPLTTEEVCMLGLFDPACDLADTCALLQQLRALIDQLREDAYQVQRDALDAAKMQPRWDEALALLAPHVSTDWVQFIIDEAGLSDQLEAADAATGTPGDLRSLGADLYLTDQALHFEPDEFAIFEFCGKSLADRLSYVSGVQRACWINALNAPEACDTLDSKHLAYEQLRSLYGREALFVQSESDWEAFRDFCSGRSFVVKKSDVDSMGRGVEPVRIGSEPELHRRFVELIEDEGEFLVEETIEQHSTLAALNASSVNTVRIIVLQGPDGAQIPDCFMKVGRAGSFIDNGGAGGILVRIDPSTGAFVSDGYDERAARYAAHPDSGVTFKGFQLPAWNEALRVALTASAAVEGLGYAGWDLTFTQDERWIVVEGNARTQFVAQQLTARCGRFEQISQQQLAPALRQTNQPTSLYGYVAAEGTVAFAVPTDIEDLRTFTWVKMGGKVPSIYRKGAGNQFGDMLACEHLAYLVAHAPANTVPSNGACSWVKLSAENGVENLTSCTPHEIELLQQALPKALAHINHGPIVNPSETYRTRCAIVADLLGIDAAVVESACERLGIGPTEYYRYDMHSKTDAEQAETLAFMENRFARHMQAAREFEMNDQATPEARAKRLAIDLRMEAEQPPEIDADLIKRVAQETGWSAATTRLHMAHAQKRTGCTFEEYVDQQFWKLNEIALGKASTLATRSEIRREFPLNEAAKRYLETHAECDISVADNRQSSESPKGKRHKIAVVTLSRAKADTGPEGTPIAVVAYSLAKTPDGFEVVREEMRAANPCIGLAEAFAVKTCADEGLTGFLVWRMRVSSQTVDFVSIRKGHNSSTIAATNGAGAGIRPLLERYSDRFTREAHSWAQRIAEKAGAPTNLALERLTSAHADLGVWPKEYFELGLDALTPAEQRKRYADYLDDEFAEIKASHARNKVAHSVAKAAGWTTDVARMRIEEAMARTGCAFSEYKRFGMHEADLVTQGKLFFIHLSKILRAQYDTDPETVAITQDKVLANAILQDFLQRPWLPSDKATPSEMERLFGDRARVFYKPQAGNGGSGIRVIEWSAADAEAICADLESQPKGVVEGEIAQHPALAKLSPHAVATLRLVTLPAREGAGIDVMYAVLKLSTEDTIVDNLKNGGFAAVVDLATGALCTDAANDHGHILAAHPITGCAIRGFVVPFFGEAIALVQQAAQHANLTGYLGWDIAITPNGPVVVEVNTDPGVGLATLPLMRNKAGIGPLMKSRTRAFSHEATVCAEQVQVLTGANYDQVRDALADCCERLGVSPADYVALRLFDAGEAEQSDIYLQALEQRQSEFFENFKRELAEAKKALASEL